MIKLISENRWIRLFQIEQFKQYKDSKYRTFECDATAEEFISVWNIATEQLRDDMEIAFVFSYPTLRDDTSLILEHIRDSNELRASRMEHSLVIDGSDLTQEHQDFQRLVCNPANTQHLTLTPEHTVGSNKWFSVSLSFGGLHITPAEAMQIPRREDLLKLIDDSNHPAYNGALSTVAENLFLVEQRYHDDSCREEF